MHISRDTGIAEVWLNEQSAYANRYRNELRPRPKRWRILLFLALSLGYATVGRADTLTQVQVASYLDANTLIPFAVGVDTQLSMNLVKAQNRAWGSDWYPDSIELSMESVLRAISLYVWPGGPTLVTNQKEFPVVWDQSRIAIDPRLTVTLDPGALDFGSAEVRESVPEPGTWLLVLAGLLWVPVGKRWLTGSMRSREAV